MATENEKIVSALIEVSNSENYEKMESYFADDFVYEEVATGKICHRAKEFIDFAKVVHSEFPDHKWELISIFSTHNKVAFESVWSGTHTFSSIPEYSASGNLVKLKAATIMEFQDDKIYRVTDYYHLPLQKQE